MAPLRVMLVAGEPSGDLLGAGLIEALRRLSSRPVDVIGVGGPQMQAGGLQSLFPMQELSVMGIAEVIPRLPTLQKRIAETAGLAIGVRPDVLITIDSPDFSFRVARLVRKCAPAIPIVHYVAPQVWAWRQGRARKMSRYMDLLLALLPFEPPFFGQSGVACRFVGHPVVERGAGPREGEKFRARHSIPAEAPLVAVLPGSRHSEISRLLTPFSGTLNLLAEDFPELHVFCATVPHTVGPVLSAAKTWPGRVVISQDAREKFAGFAASNAALAASGTVSLELAACGTPHVLAYKVSPFSAMIARRMLKISHVGLVNLILGETLIPEMLQENCQPENLAREMRALLLPGSALAQRQKAAMQRSLSLLGKGQESPSLRAARAVAELLAVRGVDYMESILF